MPTLTDPADWIPDLLDANWHTAVESLRAEGHQLSSVKPVFKPVGRRDATGSVKNAANAKVYQLTNEETSRVTYGDLDEDTTVDWAIKFDVGAEYQLARTLAREIAQITHRLLLLFRDNPHPEWHRIENIRVVNSADYSDFQGRAVQFTLKRYGEPTPSAIRQVTT